MKVVLYSSSLQNWWLRTQRPEKNHPKKNKNEEELEEGTKRHLRHRLLSLRCSSTASKTLISKCCSTLERETTFKERDFDDDCREDEAPASSSSWVRRSSASQKWPPPAIVFFGTEEEDDGRPPKREIVFFGSIGIGIIVAIIIIVDVEDDDVDGVYCA